MLVRLREIQGDKDAGEEIKVLKTYLNLQEEQADMSRNIKEANAILDKMLNAKYPKLTVE